MSCSTLSLERGCSSLDRRARFHCDFKGLLALTRGRAWAHELLHQSLMPTFKHSRAATVLSLVSSSLAWAGTPGAVAPERRRELV